MGAVRRDRGFTLVEILIAIVLVGILSAVVAVGVGSLTSKGSSAACSASLDAARVAATAHTVSTGSAPTSFTAMVSSGALTLPTEATVDASGRRISGTGWTLVMRSTTPAQFACILGTPTFPIDLTATGTVQAFSLRQLSSSYTGPAVRVRRSTDNTLQDIGFTSSGDLDISALLSFVGAGNGFVATWYDQSGNGRNATQSNTSSQPRIVTAGAYEDGVRFVSGTILALTGTPASWSASVVGTPIAPGSWRTFFYTQSQQHALLLDTGLTALGAWDGGFRASGYTWAGGETAVVHVDATSANIAMSKNGGALVATGSNTNRQSAWLGNCDCGNQQFGLIREVIVFAASLSTGDRQLVDRNLGTYFGVTVA